jgi:hypothetical protein
MLHNFVAYFNYQNLFVVPLDCGYFISTCKHVFLFGVARVDCRLLYFYALYFAILFMVFLCPFSLNYNFSVHNSLCALCFPIAKDALCHNPLACVLNSIESRNDVMYFC